MSQYSPDTGGIRPIAVTIADACRISGLGTTSIYALLKAGKLRSCAIGRRRLVTYESLEQLLTPKPAATDNAATEQPRRRGWQKGRRRKLVLTPRMPQTAA